MSAFASLALNSADDVAFMVAGNRDISQGSFVDKAAMWGGFGGMAMQWYGGSWAHRAISNTGSASFAGAMTSDILSEYGYNNINYGTGGMLRRWAAKRGNNFIGRWGRGYAREQAEKSFEGTAFKLLANVYKQSRAGGMGIGVSARSAWGAFSSLTKGGGGKLIANRIGGALVTASNVAFLAPMALELGKGIASGLAYLGQDRSRLDFGSSLIDTQQAFTQRQAGLMAIHNSQLQTRSMFMREAEAFHR